MPRQQRAGQVGHDDVGWRAAPRSVRSRTCASTTCSTPFRRCSRARSRSRRDRRRSRRRTPRRASPRRSPARPIRCRRRCTVRELERPALQQHQAQAGGLVMAGAESARRFDLDDDGRGTAGRRTRVSGEGMSHGGATIRRPTRMAGRSACVRRAQSSSSISHSSMRRPSASGGLRDRGGCRAPRAVGVPKCAVHSGRRARSILLDGDEIVVGEQRDQPIAGCCARAGG